MPAAIERTSLTLRDGRMIELRPLQPGDRAEHRAFVERLSRRSSRFRFFAPIRTLESRQQDLYFELDGANKVALVACFPGERAIRAVGRYAREGKDAAEVAFVVEDGLQGLGIGRALLHRLAAIASVNGISRFTAWVLADNYDMLDLFRATGWPITITVRAGIDRVEMLLPGAPASVSQALSA